MLRNFVQTWIDGELRTTSHFHFIPGKFSKWQTTGCIKLENSWKAARKSCGHFHAETSPQFLPEFSVEMRGKFPQSCKPFNPSKNDIKTSQGHIYTTVVLAMSLYNISTFTRKSIFGNLPEDSVGKSRGNIHKENPSFFLLNFNEETMWKIPRDDPMNSLKNHVGGRRLLDWCNQIKFGNKYMYVLISVLLRLRWFANDLLCKSSVACYRTLPQ